MSYDAKVLRVLIASPSDVPEERREVPNVLRRWNNEHGEKRNIVLLPIGWETEGYPIYEPHAKGGQSILNEQIVKKADIVIGIFWTKLGTSTNEFSSGTVEEIERSASAGKPVAVYFSTQAMPHNVDLTQVGKVRDYKKELQQHAITGEYDTLSAFREQLRDHLTPLVDDALKELEITREPQSSRRKSASDWNEEDISGLVTGPRIHRFYAHPGKRQLMDQVKTYIRRWDAIKPGTNEGPATAEGKAFMRDFHPVLDAFYSLLENDEETSMAQLDRLDNAKTMLKAFSQTRFTTDGHSVQGTFWSLGSVIINLVNEVVSSV